MEFAKISAPSLKSLFVSQLQGMILSGELPAGAQLPPERELSERMQVSRAVVNAGLAELAKQGFLEVLPRQGVRVADYRRRGNLSTLVAIMEYRGGVLGRHEIRSILEVRRALEHLATESAIDHASESDMVALGETVDALARCETPAEAAEAAFIFQHTLAFIGDNNILPLIYYSFKPAVITLWIRFCRLYGVEALLHSTAQLYAHLRARDKEAASAWIEAYLGEAIDGAHQIYDDPRDTDTVHF